MGSRGCIFSGSMAHATAMGHDLLAQVHGGVQGVEAEPRLAAVGAREALAGGDGLLDAVLAEGVAAAGGAHGVVEEPAAQRADQLLRHGLLGGRGGQRGDGLVGGEDDPRAVLQLHGALGVGGDGDELAAGDAGGHAGALAEGLDGGRGGLHPALLRLEGHGGVGDVGRDEDGFLQALFFRLLGCSSVVGIRISSICSFFFVEILKK